jgi:hypothetical protein
MISLILAFGVFLAAPRQLVGRDGESLYRGDLSVLIQRADRVADAIITGVSTENFSTGSSRFDGEWAFGTHQMAVLGLSQILLANPKRTDLRVRWLPAIARASEILLSPKTRSFGTEAWKSDAIEELTNPAGRDAWLGYIALALSLHRQVDPQFGFVDVHDRIIRSLRTRIEGSSTGLFETYPSETYPVDVAACVAAIAVWGETTGSSADSSDIERLVAHWTKRVSLNYVDPRSGYLSQSVSGEVPGIPRASGTALAAYFLGFSSAPSAHRLSRALFEALEQNGDRNVMGFSTIREYPKGISGSGDIDSGPVILGASVSGTGFAIASAKRFGAKRLYLRLHRTAALFGIPFAASRGSGYVAGGPLGDAILLAMDTAILPSGKGA